MSDWFVIGIFFALAVSALIAFAAYVVMIDIPATADWRARCEAQGGIYRPQYKTATLCLKKEAVIDLR